MVRQGWRFGVLAVAALAFTAPVRAQFQSDSTAFLSGVKDRDGDKVEKLLDKPASTIILTRNGDGETALHIVTKRRDTLWLQYMIGRGADLNARDRQGNTALADAAQIGYADGAEQLLTYGAAVDLANNRGETPLILATQAHDLDTVRSLIAHGANPAIKDNVAGLSAYDYARRDGRSAAILKTLDLAHPVAKKAVSGPSL